MAVPLPPLPPTGDDDVDYRPGGRSVVDILAEEHDRIAARLAELTDPGLSPEHRSLVTDAITAAVARHLSAEEQYFYPAVRAALPGGGPLADREIDADAALLRALRDLTEVTPDDARFSVLARAAADLLRRHVDAAAREIFPALRAAASDAELIRLGNRVEIAQEAAPTRPHPGHPASPPWNRVVDPALGLVDKVRDVVAGRRTYLDDLDPPQPAPRRSEGDRPAG